MTILTRVRQWWFWYRYHAAHPAQMPLEYVRRRLWTRGDE
jgi:hypothetical protein